MKIHVDELWKYPPGITFMYEEDAWMYVGREEYGYTIYNPRYATTNMLDIEGELEVISIKPDLDMLIQSYTDHILTLVNEGWSLDGKGLNLSSYMGKLKIFTKLKSILRDV